jgi:hypothetical protein
MKVCDKCGRRSDVLWPLKPEFSGGGIEICSNCDEVLEGILDQVEKKLNEVRRHRRRLAFLQWWDKPVEIVKPKKKTFSLSRWLVFVFRKGVER